MGPEGAIAMLPPVTDPALHRVARVRRAVVEDAMVPHAELPRVVLHHRRLHPARLALVVPGAEPGPGARLGLLERPVFRPIGAAPFALAGSLVRGPALTGPDFRHQGRT